MSFEKITAQGKYALLLIRALKRKESSGSDSPLTLYSLVNETGVSQYFIEQVARQLRVGGLIYPIKGPRGGYKLSEKGRFASLGHVINAAQAPRSGSRGNKKNNFSLENLGESELVRSTQKDLHKLQEKFTEVSESMEIN